MITVLTHGINEQALVQSQIQEQKLKEHIRLEELKKELAISEQMEHMEPVNNQIVITQWKVSNENLPKPSGEAKIKYQKEMCKVKPMQDLLSRCNLGQYLTLKWKVRNDTEEDWPAVPFIRNISQHFEMLFTHVGLKLKSGEECEVIFNMKTPDKCDEEFYNITLSFVDPVKHKKFGDPMIAILQLI